MAWLGACRMTFGAKAYQFIGKGFYDLAFLDHSDNFKECECGFEADLYSTCGFFLNSNISTCEEKQFQNEVLTGQWIWDSNRYREFFIYNVTNPAGVTAGNAPIVQELNPVSLVDKPSLSSVDRAALDEQGILTLSTQSNWRADPSRLFFRVTENIIVPHYVYATLLANGMQKTWNNANVQGYPEHYPLFNSMNIQSCFSPNMNPADYFSGAYADQMFPMMNDQTESLAASYYSSAKNGLQGLSFIKASRGGDENHCGYDRDCATGVQHARISMTSQTSCVNADPASQPDGNCKPNTVMYPANGLSYGVSSLRWLPSTSYFGIPEVESGDDQVWDYTAFNKVGSIFPAMNQAFFTLYDVVLAEIGGKFAGVSVQRWGLSRYHRRDENCGAGAGGDSPGIDCKSPTGLTNVGPSFDATLPGPVYISPGDFSVAAGGVGGTTPVATVKNCAGSVECSARSHEFELLIHNELGFRVGYRNSHTLSIGLQKNNVFNNVATLIPLYFTKEYFYVGQFKAYRLVVYEQYLSACWGESFYCSIVMLPVIFFMLVWSCLRIFKRDQIDISGFLTDRPCM